MKEFKVSVCVLQATKLSVGLDGNFMAKGETVSGTQIVEYKDGCILWNDNLYQELSFIPQQKDATIEVYDVKIGINFHWERTETQTFKGAMNMLADNGKICAINILNVEDYLISVISSEMKATSPLEFLKSHAVISRSWLIAQIEKRRKLLKNNQNNTFFSFHKNDNSLIRWYDREDHILFDVCADDHCQRYQGIQRADNPAVIQAVNETRGLVLMSEGKICDARFSKCCGGMMEQFDACWEDVNMPYLVGKRDVINLDADAYDKLDLTEENDAKQWIQSNPPAFCNTSNYRVLSNILNAYDTETMDFYRWELTYKQAELAELINKKTKIDFGEIIDLVPVKRGKSGRIYMLKIVGTERSFTIGKELEIRRVLSTTHLKSSAFIVQRNFNNAKPPTDSVPDSFTLKGAGWGHGVGLCQIGAAVMGESGYGYQEILSHYYPGAQITAIYE